MPPTIDPESGCEVPSTGSWPVDPQEATPITEDRIWIDGCFDFFHHGHAGVMLQSRRLGTSLVVGLHSDEDIAANKGPTVMNLAERVAAVDASRFATKSVPRAPYVTSLPWISHYGCQYVTHGDDITSDAGGEDCYRFVKKAGRMKIVPRTPGISTTDLVGRMLLCTKEHFIGSLVGMLEGREGAGGEEEKMERGRVMRKRIGEYAAAPNGRDPYVDVYSFQSDDASPKGAGRDSANGTFTSLIPGLPPRPGQRIVYVDGGFDLFSSGHIAFLSLVTSLERDLASQRGWYTEEARSQRLAQHGEDYSPAYVVAGVHDDDTINRHKGVNYPIMNIYERGLCVLQCRYLHAVVFGAPYTPSGDYLSSLPAVRTSHHNTSLPDAVYHGPTAFMPSTTSDPYADAKTLNLFCQTPEHAFQDVNAAQIVRRILERRGEYEERQRKKGVKSMGEGVLRREEMEREVKGV